MVEALAVALQEPASRTLTTPEEASVALAYLPPVFVHPPFHTQTASSVVEGVCDPALAEEQSCAGTTPARSSYAADSVEQLKDEGWEDVPDAMQAELQGEGCQRRPRRQGPRYLRARWIAPRVPRALGLADAETRRLLAAVGASAYG